MREGVDGKCEGSNGTDLGESLCSAGGGGRKEDRKDG